MPEAVGFDDQAAIAPQEVDLVRPDARVDLRLGKAVTAAEGEEDSLELGTDEVVGAAEIVARDQAQIERPPDGCPGHRQRRGGAEVAEGSLRCRQRDAVAAGRNTGNEGGGSMDANAASSSATAIAEKSHVDRPVAWSSHSPQRRRAEVTDDGPLAERQHRRRAPALEGEVRMAQGVHPAMNAVKAAGVHALADALAGESS